MSRSASVGAKNTKNTRYVALREWFAEIEREAWQKEVEDEAKAKAAKRAQQRIYMREYRAKNEVYKEKDRIRSKQYYHRKGKYTKKPRPKVSEMPADLLERKRKCDREYRARLRQKKLREKEGEVKDSELEEVQAFDITIGQQTYAINKYTVRSVPELAERYRNENFKPRKKEDLEKKHLDMLEGLEKKDVKKLKLWDGSGACPIAEEVVQLRLRLFEKFSRMLEILAAEGTHSARIGWVQYCRNVEQRALGAIMTSASM